MRFVPAPPGEAGVGLDLRTIDEDAAKLRWLQGFITDVAKGPVAPPEFIAGRAHLYSDEERHNRIRLPARLFGNLSPDSANAMAERMRNEGLDVQISTPAQVQSARKVVTRTALGFLALTVILGVTGLAIGAGIAFGLGLVFTLSMAARHSTIKGWVERTYPRFHLRPVPAALPASDPLVARLAALLQSTEHGEVPGDVREVVGELALLMQRLVDHRATLARDPRELDMLAEPLAPLVGAIEGLVQQLHHIGHELRSLDEGAMVRALATSEARGEGPRKRQPLLQGLDRLRALEDRRAEVFHRLLEARSLLARTVEMGLAVQDPVLEHERQVARALAALGSTA